MIREATTADIPRLLEMGRKFADRAQLDAHVGYDPHSMVQTFEQMLANEDFVIFVGEAGAIGGMIARHPFNYDTRFVDELFWWSEGREGLRLLKAFEDWAGSRGALVRMTALEAVEPERVGQLYERRGYVPLERAYIRVV